jgi:hypothetical protein
VKNIEAMKRIILNNVDQMVIGDYPHQTEQANHVFLLQNEL